MGAGIDTAGLLKQIASDNASAPSFDSIDTAIRKRRAVYPRWSGALGTCTDDAMASTTTAEQQMGSLGVASARITAIYYVPNAGITADAANNAVITVSKRTSAGGSKTTLGTLTTNLTLGNLVQGQQAAFTLTATAADLVCAAGATLSFEIAKNGTGVVTRSGCIVVEYLEE